MVFLKSYDWLIVLLATAAFAFGVGTLVVPASSSAPVETIYIVDHAGQYISAAQIHHDIPAWQQAANKDFAPVWGTAQVKLELVSKVPADGISALFVKSGPVQGALAYHTVTHGVPQIVVYAGVGDFYGYSNSVSFTHELFELLADPSISITNQGYPYGNVCTIQGNCFGVSPGTVWANEVCDPVEEYAYRIDSVAISDFITPNWFDDRVNGPIDFMHYLQTPLTIGAGGYAQWWDGAQWNVIENFRHAPNRDAAGFLKGERRHGRG